jgi:hypothetical protein
LGPGSKCIRPTECQKGEYCNYAAEAGTSDAGNAYGLCANVLAQNAKCGQPPFGATFSYDECAYKGWQQPPRFCNYDTYPNPAGYFCGALRPNAQVCYSDNECTSTLCIDVTDAGSCDLGNCQCQNTRDFTTFCRALKIKDAGPG